jgi:hypothetical protein
MNPLTQSKNTAILPVLITLTLVCFGLSPQARAVCQEGCLTNQNTVLGDDALLNNTGLSNTAIGARALFNNTTGDNNTAIGLDALVSNTTGSDNTAIGFQALIDNTVGSANTATGFHALLNNAIGSDNTANGQSALFSNTIGGDNTATGALALNNNTIGSGNTATGASALLSNTAGFNNTANGDSALFSNTTGLGNTATGASALSSNTTGNYNTATGFGALSNNTTAIYNTAIGFQALQYNRTGNGNIALGYLAGSQLTTGSHNIDIGHRGVAGESRTIRIGRQGTQTTTVIAGINGATVAGGIAVLIDSHGRLGTTTSSARFKDKIKPMGKASEAILALEPVTFRYKHELDPEGIPQFGLVAEDVEKVNPDLVVRDEQGKPYTVRYEAVTAMLLNEFLKEHRKVEEQQAAIKQLESRVAQYEDLRSTVAQQERQIQFLTAGVKEQVSQIQKMSAQLEVSPRRTPQVVLNNQ